MVSKSYVVSKTVLMNEKCDSGLKMQPDDYQYSKNKDRIIVQVDGEVVKQKPSKMFHDDNSSSANYWSSIKIIKWNRERLDEAVNYINLRLLIKIITVSISIALIGFIVTSLLSASNNNNNNYDAASKRQRLLISINKTINNDSIIDTSTASDIFASIETSNTVSPSSTNVITTQNEHTKKSNDEITFKRDYVERINFYTTSNKNLFSVKVSPTLPSIMGKNFKSTSELPVQNYANDCESTSLPLCQGILSYDLTDSKRKWNLTNIEYQHFQHLVSSNCSNRVHEYVCQYGLEPECRPSKMKNLKPCRRICKGIFESCSHIIASSEVLTEFFDCNSFIDSNDHTACEDITRTRKNCYEDEFQCKSDLSCIPMKWRCDNIRDCASGEDEEECKFCNYDEFKCLSDQKCISAKWVCDGTLDCQLGEDEENCDDDYVESDENERIFYDDIKDYSEQASIVDHNDSDGDKIISTGDDVVPIFINPNSTLNDSQTTNSIAKLSKRFRSTMRKTTTPVFEETSTSTTKRVTSHSTAHISPCPEDHLRCVDGLCITLDQICDKIQDCSDNSDELHCEY